MTALTINMESFPVLGRNVELAAKRRGMSAESFVISVIIDYLEKESNMTTDMPERFRKLRGSLAALKDMKLEDDDRAKMILGK